MCSLTHEAFRLSFNALSSLRRSSLDPCCHSTHRSECYPRKYIESGALGKECAIRTYRFQRFVRIYPFSEKRLDSKFTFGFNFYNLIAYFFDILWAIQKTSPYQLSMLLLKWVGQVLHSHLILISVQGNRAAVVGKSWISSCGRFVIILAHNSWPPMKLDLLDQAQINNFKLRIIYFSSDSMHF